MEDRRRKKGKAGQDSLLHLGQRRGKKARGIRGNLKSDSDDDAQNKRFLICESAALELM